MPLGNPEAYMAQGMPPEEAMMMAGGPPMAPPIPPQAGPVGPPMPPMMEPEPVDLLPMLLQAVQGKWAGQEAQLAGEQDLLVNTLQMIANAQPPAPAEMFAEGVDGNAGMEPGFDIEEAGPGLPPMAY